MMSRLRIWMTPVPESPRYNTRDGLGEFKVWTDDSAIPPDPRILKPLDNYTNNRNTINTNNKYYQATNIHHHHHFASAVTAAKCGGGGNEKKKNGNSSLDMNKNNNHHHYEENHFPRQIRVLPKRRDFRIPIESSCEEENFPPLSWGSSRGSSSSSGVSDSSFALSGGTIGGMAKNAAVFGLSGASFDSGVAIGSSFELSGGSIGSNKSTSGDESIMNMKIGTWKNMPKKTCGFCYIQYKRHCQKLGISFPRPGDPGFWVGHDTKDENGDVICPELSKLMCPLCFATGKKAHTMKFCPVTMK